MTSREARETFEATPLVMRVIAGLLVAIISLGTAWAVSVNSKLARMDDYGDSLAVHRMQIQGLYEMKQDIRDIKTDLRALSNR